MRFLIPILAVTTIAVGCSSDSALRSGDGRIFVQLTDAPFPFDSVESVNVHVVRVDARVAEADSATADSSLDATSSRQGGWRTIAEPDRAIDLLTLRDGNFTTIGETDLPAGTYRALRLIIDPSRSDVRLKDNTVLTGESDPGVKFPSANRSGLKINLETPLVVGDGDSTTVLVDFDVGQSFVMRGNSLSRNGLLFKPVIKANVRDE
jgi:hypothetical protein